MQQCNLRPDRRTTGYRYDHHIALDICLDIHKPSTCNVQTCGSIQFLGPMGCWPHPVDEPNDGTDAGPGGGDGPQSKAPTHEKWQRVRDSNPKRKPATRFWNATGPSTYWFAPPTIQYARSHALGCCSEDTDLVKLLGIVSGISLHIENRKRGRPGWWPSRTGFHIVLWRRYRRLRALLCHARRARIPLLGQLERVSTSHQLP